MDIVKTINSIVEINPSRWKEYKKLRLEALKNNPEAFGSDYSDSLKYPISHWKKGLVDSEKGLSGKLFFCEHYGKLVGLIGLVFFEGKKLHHRAKMVAFYVSPGFRGKGIGDSLIKHALNYLKKLKHITKIESAVNDGRVESLHLQLKNGFKVIGRAHREIKIGKRYLNQTLLEKLV